MNKSDLKTGMIVELRNGKELVVFIDTCIEKGKYDNTSFLVNVDKGDWIGLNKYTNSLLYIRKNGYAEVADYDIVKVYKPAHVYSFMNIKYKEEERKLIWSRKKLHMKVTMQDIENKFGYKVDIVDLKK